METWSCCSLSSQFLQHILWELFYDVQHNDELNNLCKTKLKCCFVLQRHFSLNHWISSPHSIWLTLLFSHHSGKKLARLANQAHIYLNDLHNFTHWYITEHESHAFLDLDKFALTQLSLYPTCRKLT